MVKKTKQRLMWSFAILTMVFLLLFVVIAYVTVSRSILSDQEDIVTAKISDKYIERFVHEANEQRGNDNNNDEDSVGDLIAIVSYNGEVVQGHGEDLEELIEDWIPTSLEIREVDEDNRDYLIAARPLENIGYVYSGTEITQQKVVLNRLFVVLLLLTALFTFVAMALSFIMTGKAIRPIMNSVERQRDFVNDASHELRTPLSILSAGLVILEEEDGDKLSDFSKQTVDDMSDEVRRMSSLVNNLLLLARSDSGKLVLEKKEFDLSALLFRSIRSFSKVVEDNELSLTSDIQENVHFTGDQERLKQLLYLFLDNAVKYNKKNGNIHVQLNTTEIYNRISVKDTGIGIAPEHQKKIFNRFYRVDETRSRAMGSNGIGLSIARFIVQAHGGFIEVDSTVGKSTCFTILLPK